MKYIPHPFKQNRKCRSCDTKFIATTGNSIYCKKCRDDYFKTGLEGLPCGTIGTVSELVACSDLLKKGYEVFRAMSPSCSCDLAVLKDGKLKRIEVRTGRRYKNGVVHPSGRQMKADILAIVIHRENIVVYEPKL